MQEWSIKLTLRCKTNGQCDTDATLRLNEDKNKFELYLDETCSHLCNMEQLLDKKLLISLSEINGIRLFATQLKAPDLAERRITFEIENPQYDLLQRRRYLRIPVNWPSVLAIDLSPSAAPGTHLIYHECDILDVSAGGLKLRGNGLLPEDSLIALSFGIPDLEINDTLARIVWQQPIEGQFITAIEFIAIDQSTESNIVSYVFKKEIAQKNRPLKVSKVQIIEPAFSAPIETGFRPLEFKGRRLTDIQNKKASCKVVNMTLDNIYLETHLKLPLGLIIELELSNRQEGNSTFWARIVECIPSAYDSFILKLEMDKNSDGIRKLARHLFYCQNS